ncbi:MAG: DUF3168 domain-containing protein [Pseudomonadota bacterium]
MIGAPWSLQLGLYDVLRQSAEVQSALGNPARIFDAVPPDTAFPFITIGEARVDDYPGVSGAREHDIRIHIYTRWGGRQEVKQIADSISNLLHEREYPLADHQIVQSRFVFADIFRQLDADTYQGVMRFRIVTEPSV